MEVTGEQVIEMCERSGLILGEWQREMIRRMGAFTPEAGPLWPEPRKPVLTRRVQRRRQTRAERRRARQRPQPGNFLIIDELAR